MSFARRGFVALDHVQLAMPPGAEAAARAFYIGVLGMRELDGPRATTDHEGVRFAGGEGAVVQIHLGAEPDCRPVRTAHPAVLVAGVDELADCLDRAGHPVEWQDDATGLRRFYCRDPFGNRLEFIGEPGE